MQSKSAFIFLFNFEFDYGRSIYFCVSLYRFSGSIFFWFNLKWLRCRFIQRKKGVVIATHFRNVVQNVMNIHRLPNIIIDMKYIYSTWTQTHIIYIFHFFFSFFISIRWLSEADQQSAPFGHIYEWIFV